MDKEGPPPGEPRHRRPARAARRRTPPPPRREHASHPKAPGRSCVAGPFAAWQGTPWTSAASS
eukprot:669923-Prymnesium_polylepis.1